MSELSNPPRTFEEFWPHYLADHQHPSSRALHALGTALALLCIALAPWVSLWLLLLAPVVGYSFAWLGHFRFEKNQPTTWDSPLFALWSLRGDFRLMWRLLTGKETLSGAAAPQNTPRS